MAFRTSSNRLLQLCRIPPAWTQQTNSDEHHHRPPKGCTSLLAAEMQKWILRFAAASAANTHRRPQLVDRGGAIDPCRHRFSSNREGAASRLLQWRGWERGRAGRRGQIRGGEECGCEGRKRRTRGWPGLDGCGYARTGKERSGDKEYYFLVETSSNT